MLRLVDVPSRNVTGFVGGTYNRFGEFDAKLMGLVNEAGEMARKRISRPGSRRKEACR